MSRLVAGLRRVAGRSGLRARPVHGLVVGGTALYVAYHYTTNNFSVGAALPVVEARAKPEGAAPVSALNYRQRRFLRYASIEVEGVAYMTPRDFLESVIEMEPRPRIGRLQMDGHERDKMLQATIPLGKGSEQMFRTLNDRGLVSYTEYLFLLSVLTKPEQGFRVAFNMFDADGNQRVDRHEFQVMERSLNLTMARRVANAQKQVHNDSEGGSEGAKQQINIESINDLSHTETTLLRHFFGKRGNGDLSFKDFHKFMVDLQTEVLQLEFAEYSKGMPLISELEFARMLLRYTYITPEHYGEYLQRVTKHLPSEEGIGFQEFKDFFNFLTNIEDFAIALNMHVISGKPISRGEFQRAVRVSMGFQLNPRVLAVVFSMFDSNNDNHLSYYEFLAIMKDRLHRGFRSHLLQKEGSWDAFKTCMRHEMKVVG